MMYLQEFSSFKKIIKIYSIKLQRKKYSFMKGPKSQISKILKIFWW